MAFPSASTYRVVHAPPARLSHVANEFEHEVVHNADNMLSASYLPPKPAQETDSSQLTAWLRTATHVDDRLVACVVRLYI
jgi:hypothetical protein